MSSGCAPARGAPDMVKFHNPCGVTVGCAQVGVWQPGLVVVVFLNTPPSDEKKRGHAFDVTPVANAMSPESSCAPAVRVNGPAQEPDALQRWAPPVVAGDGVVHVPRWSRTSPNQRS